MISVPVLDLRGDRDAVAGALRDGFETTGFAVLEGHAVEPALIERAYRSVVRFFELPEAVKARSGGAPGGQRGFTPFGVEHARDSAVGDLKEFFHVGRELPPGHRRRVDYPDNRWPAEVPQLRPALVALYGALDTCAERILEALAHGYGLPARTFAAMLEEGNSILRALHYPPIASAPEGALRAAPHEDINLITLLCGATDSGLEIRTTDGNWLAIEARPGQIVADSGDMLLQATGGAIPATTHRVVNSTGAARRSRYSLPFFAHPPPECDLSVLEAFATPERIAAHPPITAGAFLAQRLDEIGLGRA